MILGQLATQGSGRALLPRNVAPNSQIRFRHPHPSQHSSQMVTINRLSKARSRPLMNYRSINIACQAASAVPNESVSLVLLAGGVGKRMGAAIPKQYLTLNNQPIATFSLRTFASMPQVAELVVVCEPEWRYIFEECYASLPRQPPLKFALPGSERQDSVFNGFQSIAPTSQLVAIHDSARPLITPEDAERCFVDALTVGAAVLGVRVKPTIKEATPDGKVVKTLTRAVLWEVQTPQVIRPELLRRGFEVVRREGLEVTDDVSIIEALGEPVVITPGAYTNIKVTTPEDMSVAERFLEEHDSVAVAT